MTTRGAWLARLMLASLGVQPSDASGSAAREAVPGQLLLKPRAGLAKPVRTTLAARLGGRVLRELRLVGVQVVEVAPDRVDAALAAARRDPAIEYAERNWIVRAGIVPDDLQFGEQWALRNTGQSGGTPGADIRAALAWGLYRGEPALRIGIIDTGADLDHPDLAPNLWTNPGEIAANGVDDDANGYIDDVHGWDVVGGDGDPSDDHGHGSHVAGTIGAVGDNATGIAGVAWACDLVPIKFLDNRGMGTIDGAIAALEYAVTVGVALTNNSWSGGGFSQALLDAIEVAGAANQLFVASAGNDAGNNDWIPVYPASYASPCIVAVAATDDSDGLASFSCFGATSVDLAAPGVDVLSCMPGGGYTLLSGTSMAAPHVTGVAALLFGRAPGIACLEVKQRLLASAMPTAALAGRCVTGARLDALAALSDPEAVTPGAISDLAVIEVGSTTLRLGWTATGDDAAAGSAALYDLRYSTAPIDAGNFAAATALDGPDPSPAGSIELFEVEGLGYETTYWFALRALDEHLNAGPISNVTSGTTSGIPDIQLFPTSVTVDLQSGDATTRSIVITNAGTGWLDFAVAVPEVVVANAAKRAAPSRQRDVPLLAKGTPDPRRGPPVVAGRGGPDALGYRWEDSDEPGGAQFDWIDITAIGTPIALDGDDQVVVGIPIGFPFPFYGYVHEQVNICSNGFLSFTSLRGLYLNQPLPNAGYAVSENLVAPFWDDLDFSPATGNGRAYSHSDGTRLVVAYVDVPHWAHGGGPYTFEAILYRSGEIRFQYLSIGEPNTGATVGIQDYSRTVGLQAAFNAHYVHAGLLVRFLPVPQWVLAVPPGTGRAPAGGWGSVVLRFDSVGLGSGAHDAFVRIFSNDPDASPYVLPVRLQVSGTVSDASTTQRGVAALALAGAHPARGRARLRLQLAAPGRIDTCVYDVRGALVRALPALVLDAGPHLVEWDGRDAAGRPVAAGSYLVRVREPAGTHSARVILLK